MPSMNLLSRGSTARRPVVVEAPADAPCVVVTGARRLVPEGLDRPSIAAWLAAPIGGVALARRVLEPLLGLGVRVVEVVSDRAAPAFASAVNGGSCFGIVAGVIDSAEAVSANDRPLVVLPCSGIATADLADALRAADSGDGDRWAIVPLLGDDGTRSVAVVAGRNAPKTPLLKDDLTEEHVRASAVALGVQLVRREWGRFHRTDSPVALRHVAQAAISGSWRGGSPIGTWQGPVLVGARARLGRETSGGGTAAVGEESFVAQGAEIGDGAVIGVRCYVGPSALVRDAVILDGSEVRPGETVEGVVRCGTRDLR